MFYRKTSTAAMAVFSLSILLGLWSVFNLSSCQDVERAASGRSAKNSLELQVMSFNIRYGAADDGENRWENRRQMVFDVVGDNHPDVVGLQEALRFQIDEIRKALPAYGEIGVAREDGKTKGEYCAILYRHDRFDIDESGTFWLSNTPEVPGSNHWGNACVRICTWARFIEKKSNAAFYLYNTHLDHVSQPSRENSAVLLAQRISSRKPVDPFVLTGDFNAGEDNPVIMYLKGNTALSGPASLIPAEGRQNEGKSTNPVPMADTFRLLHPNAKEVGTAHDFQGSRQGNKIDYVLTPPQVQVLEAKILHDNVGGRYPSDHFPVTARLRLPVASERRVSCSQTNKHNRDGYPTCCIRSSAFWLSSNFCSALTSSFRGGTLPLAAIAAAQPEACPIAIAGAIERAD